MQVSHGWPVRADAASAVAFGNFDGVHMGHRAIIGALRAEAAQQQDRVTVVTFDPHPLVLLRPERAPRAIDPLAQRLERLAELGVDLTVILRFDDALRRMTAREFGDKLIHTLGARVFVGSDDSRFGHGGAGDLGFLRDLAAPAGVRVLRIPGVSLAGASVSSSRIRGAVQRGDVGMAADLLRRAFALYGTVVHGDAAGRSIGFPTANLASVGQVMPHAGVYAIRAQVGGGTHDGVANLGTRPTVGGTAFRVEAHLFDFDQDVYGEPMALMFLARLRDERRFDGLTALRAAIAEDCVAARAHTRQASLRRDRYFCG